MGTMMTKRSAPDAADTAMAHAFRAAGYDVPGQKLRKLAYDLLRGTGGNAYAACDSLMDAARRDAGLLRALALHYLGDAAADMAGKRPATNSIGGNADVEGVGQDTLGTHRQRAHPSAPNSETPAAVPAGGGQRSDDTQRATVSPSPHPVSNDRGRGQHEGGAHRVHAASTNSHPAPAGGAGQGRPVTHSPGARPIPSPGHSKRGLAAIASVSGTVARSMLDGIVIRDGVPLRRATVEEADAWANHRGREAAFVKLVITGLPHGAVIGQFVDDARAAELWRHTERGVRIAPTIDARKPDGYREMNNA